MLSVFKLLKTVSTLRCNTTETFLTVFTKCFEIFKLNSLSKSYVLNGLSFMSMLSQSVANEHATKKSCKHLIATEQSPQILQFGKNSACQ